MARPTIHRPAYVMTSVDHALRLIQLLRDTGGLRVSDAARELGVAASTAHRLLSMLVYRGFAVQDDDRGYAPGPALGAAPSQLPWARALRDLLVPHMELLSGRVGETVNLMVRVGGNVRFLASEESANLLRVSDRTGAVLEAHQASGGKAILAELERSELERLYRSRAAAIAGDHLDTTRFTALLRELEQIRARGHSENREATEAGVCAVGCALHDVRGRAVAAFTVSFPTTRAALFDDERFLELIRETRGEMDAELARHEFDAATGTARG
ncbi:IclR family transcriptional regulator [Microbacterium gorillae]|uniref:IclR family transcriptional regulator n=1 Tax=Microbacterium gorillae TaxID=1231063 RepID=UPI00058D6989|nr:IclR family transcriptional regulator [Microbacterium gorillae]